MYAHAYVCVCIYLRTIMRAYIHTLAIFSLTSLIHTHAHIHTYTHTLTIDIYTGHTYSNTHTYIHTCSNMEQKNSSTHTTTHKCCSKGHRKSAIHIHTHTYTYIQSESEPATPRSHIHRQKSSHMLEYGAQELEHTHTVLLTLVQILETDNRRARRQNSVGLQLVSALDMTQSPFVSHIGGMHHNASLTPRAQLASNVALLGLDLTPRTHDDGNFKNQRSRRDSDSDSGTDENTQEHRNDGGNTGPSQQHSNLDDYAESTNNKNDHDTTHESDGDNWRNKLASGRGANQNDQDASSRRTGGVYSHNAHNSSSAQFKTTRTPSVSSSLEGDALLENNNNNNNTLMRRARACSSISLVSYEDDAPTEDSESTDLRDALYVEREWARRREESLLAKVCACVCVCVQYIREIVACVRLCVRYIRVKLVCVCVCVCVCNIYA
jgi:hypothetical protein